MHLREEIRKPVSSCWRHLRDERRKKRELLILYKNQMKRVKKKRRRRRLPVHMKKGDFVNFKINGMTNDEAQKYQMALANFIAQENSLQGTLDEFSESEEDLSGENVPFGEEDKSETEKTRAGRHLDILRVSKGGEVLMGSVGKLRNLGKEEVVKRKRGRPSKVKPNENSDEAAEIVKRKRGRPGKVKPNENSDEAAEIVKRKRGRPGKVKSNENSDEAAEIVKRTRTRPGKVKTNENSDEAAEIVKRKRGRPRKVKPNKNSDEAAMVDLEILEKSPIMECRVVLTRLLPCDIAQRLGPQFGNDEEVENCRSSEKLKRSPVKTVIAEERETTEEEDYLLDEENILELFSGNNDLSYHSHSPSHPDFTDEEDSCSPPILTSPTPTFVCENSWSPPPLLPFETEENYFSNQEASLFEKTRQTVSTVDCHELESLSQPQQGLAHLVPALEKMCGYLDLVCVDWNHSAKPSKLIPESLTDCQLSMLVTAIEASPDKLCQMVSTHGQITLDPTWQEGQNWDQGWCPENHPSFGQQEINVAFQVMTRNVSNCVPRNYSVQQAAFEETEDVLKIEVQLKKHTSDFCSA